jgi:hypothetical protein
VALSRQLLHNMFREDIATAELCPAPHQTEQSFFPIGADQGYVSEIND